MAHSTASDAWMQRKAAGSLAANTDLPEELADDPRWQLVQRIASSDTFARATRLSSFLLYVTRQALAEQGTDLNEQSIGERVFARPLGYDSREDNIVRAHASRLRQRLESYFTHEGAHETLRVAIPRGSYVPQFERAANVVEEPAATPSSGTAQASEEDSVAIRAHTEQELRETPPNIKYESRPGKNWLWPVLSVAMLTLLVILAQRGWHGQLTPQASAAGTATHQLWSQMFASDRNTLIVPADSSLVMFAELSGHRIPLADYATGRYMTNFTCSGPCNRDQVRSVAERRYTSLADLEFAVALARRPESIPNRTLIRYVRDLQLEDFKQSNLVLAGSLEADPWLELLEKQMDFVLQDDLHKGVLQIVNRHPRGGEQSVYLYRGNTEQGGGLAEIAFLPNLNGSGNILVVQGFTLADTQAAAEFVTNGKDFDRLFAQVARTHAALPHFECLLQTADVNGVASQPIVLAWHIHSD